MAVLDGPADYTAYKVMGPASPRLGSMLVNAGWTGRQYGYARLIESFDELKSDVNPKVSIIVALENDSSIDLKSWSHLLSYNGDDVELIVMRKKTAAPLAQLLCAMATVSVGMGKSSSPGCMRNLGALYASAPTLVFLADNIAPEMSLIKAYLDFMQEDVICARGRIIGAGKEDTFTARLDCGSLSGVCPVDLTANMAINKKYFFQLGGFDETMPVCALAPELAIRMKLKNNMDQKYCAGARARLPFADMRQVAQADIASAITGKNLQAAEILHEFAAACANLCHEGLA